jgi:hypothetical protein
VPDRSLQRGRAGGSLAVEEPLEIRFNVYTEAERICLGPAATRVSINPETRPWLSVV